MATWRWYAHSDGTCCCEDPTCLIGSDNFDRANSADMGSKWTEVGTWEILSNEATGTGVLLSTYTQAAGNCTAVIYVKLKHLRDGYSYRVIVAYEDEDNYLFSQFLCTDDLGGYTISLNSRSAGVESELASESGSPYTDGQIWYTCYSPEVEFSTGLPQSDLWVTECQTGTCDVGIQAASVGLSIPTQPESGDKLAFDDWEYYRHNSWRADCPFCDCMCQEPDQKTVCLPEALTLTLHNVFGCSGVDGYELTLLQSYTAKTQWDSPPGSGTICGSELITVNLTCAGGSYTLTITLDAGSSWVFSDSSKVYTQTLSPGDSGYACSPLQLTFPYFELSAISECEPLPCCTDPSCGDGYAMPRLYPEITA